MSRELDAEVAEKVMGLTVVGKATCVHVEGEWSVHVDSGTNGWACHAEESPVFAHDPCYCRADGPMVHTLGEDDTEEDRATVARMNQRDKERYESDMARFGHTRYCLQAVPEFSSTWSGMQLVVEKLQERFDMVSINYGVETKWWCTLYPATGLHIEGEAADTAPEAVCRAALSALSSPPAARPESQE